MPTKSVQKKIPLKKKPIKRFASFVVYILKCSDATYYTGYTSDINKRLELHNKGIGAKYVRSKRPVKLVYIKPFRYYKNALNEERRIKTFTRKQKESLITDYTQKKLKESD